MKINQNDFVDARAHGILTTADVIRILREKKGWTQEDLAQKSNISATNISMLENGRLDIGKKRAEQLAKAFGIHPAIIMFPEYDVSQLRLAA